MITEFCRTPRNEGGLDFNRGQPVRRPLHQLGPVRRDGPLDLGGPMKRLIDDHSERLLVNRQDAARILGNVSIATIIRLEQAGRLRRVRLNPAVKSPKAFYTRGDVFALVEG